MEELCDSMASKQVFRNLSQDEECGGLTLSAAASLDTSVVIAGLKTFSCESDVESMEKFNPDRYFGLCIESETIPKSLPYRQTTDPKPNKQQKDYAARQTAIVTPQKLDTNAVDIFLEPLPESHIHPFLMAATTGDNRMQNAPGLLFPLAEDSECLTVTTKPVCKNPPSFPETNLDKQHNDRPSNKHLKGCTVCDTYVYKQLRPSLPLPESFGPILCFLLHMELTSTIDRAVLSQACEIFNEEWEGATRGLFKSNAGNEKNLQNISGNIVDAFVETLGPTVDFPVLFQESAQTYNNRAEEDSLLIFFQKPIDFPGTKECDPQDLGNVEAKEFASNVCTDRGKASGEKRKRRTSDADEEQQKTSEKRPKLLPTVLKLAISYGAKQAKLEDGQTSLEDFVKKTSSQLQLIDPMEWRNEWNDFIEVWNDFSN